VKVRVRHTKLGKVRFVGNLDVTRLWERALRKAALPVAYSTGFSPRPRLSFGLALPMGAGSIAEYVDIEFATDVPLDGLAERLSEAMPVGFDVLALTEKVPGQVSLQEDVVACDWELELDGVPAEDARRAVDAAMAEPQLLLERERKGEKRTDDVRPSIEALAIEEADRVVLRARLATVGRGLRPAELISVVFPGRGDHTEVVHGVLRTEQWIERDGARRELLPLPGARPVPTELVGA
jgi:radical SAM-linked protein